MISGEGALGDGYGEQGKASSLCRASSDICSKGLFQRIIWLELLFLDLSHQFRHH